MTESQTKVPKFPFEDIEMSSMRTAAQAQVMAMEFLAEGGTGEALLAQINESKSPVLSALLFADHHLPILKLIPDFSECAKAAVYCAVANGAYRTLDLLIERGADVYAKLDSTPPLVAAAGNRGVKGMACSRRLLAAGVDPNVARSDIGMTALMQAAAAGDMEFVRHLIESGADIERRDSKGCTALHWAIGYGAGELRMNAVPSSCVEVVRLLLDAGADVNGRDFSRMTPLHHLAGTRATLSGADAAALIDLVLLRGADIEARCFRQRTPIVQAADNPKNGASLIEVLHARGADLDVKVRGVALDRMDLPESSLRVLRSIRVARDVDAAMPGGDGAPPVVSRGAGMSPL